MENKKKKFGIYFLLVAIVGGVVFLMHVYFLKNRKFTPSSFKVNYNMLDPGIGLYDQKDLIVNIQPLRDQWKELENEDNISIYLEILNTGANLSVNKDVKIFPASLMKIPIAMAVMKKIEKGQWSMDKDFVLEDREKNAIFGKLYREQVGSRFTTEKLLNEMLINSDNTARNIFVKYLTLEDIDNVLEHIGMEYDYRNDGQISAKKYSIFWRSLFESTYLSPDSSQLLIAIMSKSGASNYLSQGIAQDTKFSHKIGVLYNEGIFADSGIVYLSQRPYILTVMVKNKNQQEAEIIMKNISQKAYEYISQYGK